MWYGFRDAEEHFVLAQELLGMSGAGKQEDEQESGKCSHGQILQEDIA